MQEIVKTPVTDALWITWEKQRRNHSMSCLLGVPLYELISHKGKLGRYLSLGWQTLRLLNKEKPSTVFAQNPSIVLSLLVVLARRPFSYRVIIDEHNAGLFPQEGRSRLLGAIARYIVRQADQVIVTNQKLKVQCEQWGGQALVIPDPLPAFTGTLLEQARRFSTTTPQQPLTGLFICTWSADEPYREVIEASRQFSSQQLQLGITGNPGDKLSGLLLPDNITVHGFLSEVEFLKALANCHFVVVQTTRQDCLNCGAYEAVAMEKPGLLTDTQALKSYFREGFVFCRTDAESLIGGFNQVMQSYGLLCSGVKRLKETLKNNQPVPAVFTEQD